MGVTAIGIHARNSGKPEDTQATQVKGTPLNPEKTTGAYGTPLRNQTGARNRGYEARGLQRRLAEDNVNLPEVVGALALFLLANVLFMRMCHSESRRAQLRRHAF